MNRICVPAGAIALCNSSRRSGGALISVLAFVTVISFITTSMMRLTVSHYQLAKRQCDFESAVYVAEAGIDYELRALSNSPLNADTTNSGNPYGPTYNLPAVGVFQVYVSNRDGSIPWTEAQSGIVTSRGIVNGTIRTVSAYFKPVGGGGSSVYALWGETTGNMVGNCTVTGNVGTNGTFSFGSNCSVSGIVEFNGPLSNWVGGVVPSGIWNTVYNANKKIWPTVDSMATSKFGSTALVWLKAHNDNGLSVPPISSDYVLHMTGNDHTTFYGKPGGANYYLEGITLEGTSDFSFDNTAGPINVWVGPTGSNPNIDWRGGSATISMSTNPINAVRFYSATVSDIVQVGNSQIIDCEIYNMNGWHQGGFIAKGTPNIYGTVIVNNWDLRGNVGVTYVSGYQPYPQPLYYSFDNVYTEDNPSY
ncbi:MAG: hypothetical protein ABJA67_17270 [Chthonomonadales bacterium]